MKLAVEATPNVRLRDARTARGWSQEHLAELLGTTPLTIHRWERGLVVPRPYFREKLCALFGCEAVALGLVPEQDRAAAQPAQGASAEIAPPPAPPNPLVGRQRDLEAVAAYLRAASPRLLTITGAAGVGKTRLALEVAHALGAEFPHGVAFVSLAPVRAPTEVAPAVAQALGVRETGAFDVEQQLVQALRVHTVLLVLDNCEHVLETVAILAARLLASSPDLGILATSRAPLRISGEQEYRLLPLALPGPSEETPETLAQVPSIALFLARARQSAPAFTLTTANVPVVAAICRRLDGLPLAIELAAAQCRLLTPAGLLARLQRRLDALAGGARDLPDRQRSFRATLAWSYDLLPAPARALFRRLAVFAGGGAIEAVERVCQGTDASASGADDGQFFDPICALVDHSLVICQVELQHHAPGDDRQGPGDDAGEAGVEGEAGETTRLTLLETMRDFAWEQLRLADEVEATKEAHARYFLELAEAADSELRGPRQARWLAWLEREQDNLREALRWARQREDLELALRLTTALWRYWYVRGSLREARRWQDALLALAPPAVLALAEVSSAASVAAPPRAQASEWPFPVSSPDEVSSSGDRGDESGDTLACWARLFNQQAIALERLGEYALAERWYERSLTLSRRLGDAVKSAATIANLGYLARLRGHYARAERLFAEALGIFEQVGPSAGVVTARTGLGMVALERGDLARAAEQFEAALALARQHGHERGIADALSNLGETACARGDYTQARELLYESLRLRRQLRHAAGIAESMVALGQVALARGDLREAAACYDEASAHFSQAGDVEGLFRCLDAYAVLVAADLPPTERGRAANAAQLFGAVEAIMERTGISRLPAWQARQAECVARLRAALGEHEYAAWWRRGRALSLEQALALGRAGASPDQ